MSLLKQIIALLKKDILLEIRNKQGVASLLLFVFATVFVVYMAFVNVKATTWVILYWIIMLFAVTNATSRSFEQETGDQQLFYYQLADSKAILIAKIIFNCALIIVLSGLTIGAFALLLGVPITSWVLFGFAVLQGSFALAIAFTILSGVASAAGNANGLLPILGFPVVIPIIGLLIAVSVDAINGDMGVNFWKNHQILFAIDMMMLALGWILFPYLWKE